MYKAMGRAALALSLVAMLAAPVLAAEVAGVSVTPVAPAPGTVRPIFVVAAPAAAPSAVMVGGKAVTFDQQPVVVDGVLMLPLRFIAEAAGGQVTWNQEAKQVHVRMPDRTVDVQIGNPKAEMNEDGVNYFARNLIAMAKEPVLLGDRTLVSADAMDRIFGFQVETAADGTLGLTALAKRPSDGGLKMMNAEDGSIARVESGRFLLSGAKMANGEPRQTWVSVGADTKIMIEEGGKQRPGGVSDLAEGAKVSVRYAGPLTMSYPASGAAAEVVVIR